MSRDSGSPSENPAEGGRRSKVLGPTASLPATSLYFCPCVFQRNCAIENQGSWFRIRIDAEIAQALKLVRSSDLGIRERRLEFRFANDVQRIRIEIVRPVFSFFHFVRIFFEEEVVV